MSKAGLLSAAGTLVLFLGILSTARAEPVETLAPDLNNPRGIAFAPNGEVYAVETGNGGDGQCGPSPAPPFLPLSG